MIRGDLSANCLSAFYLEHGTLRAACMLNDDAHMDLFRDWIAAAVLHPDTQRLADPTVPLETLVSMQR